MSLLVFRVQIAVLQTGRSLVIAKQLHNSILTLKVRLPHYCIVLAIYSTPGNAHSQEPAALHHDSRCLADVCAMIAADVTTIWQPMGRVQTSII